MDRFFKNADRQLKACDLHLSGLASMFLASKYEDEIPLLMKTVIKKVGHSKFSHQEIVEREIEILRASSFKVGGAPTILEFLDRYLKEAGIEGDEKLYTLCMFLAKMACFDSQLA